MPVRFEGQDIRTDRDVTQLLEQIRRDPRTTNPRVLWINQAAQMQAKKGGYPVDMYHEVHLPVKVMNEEEEDAMSQLGYRRQYSHREFPCYLHRRNAHPKFHKNPEEKQRIMLLTLEAQRLEMATTNDGDYVESVHVRDEAQYEKLMAQKEQKAAGIGPWCVKVTDIEPLHEGPEEDTAVTIARLQGELEGLKAKAAEKGGKKSEAA